MITNKTFKHTESGELVTSFFMGDKLYAKIIRRSNRKRWDLVFAPDVGKANLRGFKSKSRAEMHLL